MEAVINDYISRELVQDASLLPLENTTQLLETGILDSLSLLRLVIFVQEQFGIVVDDLDLVPEHFASVDDTHGRAGLRLEENDEALVRLTAVRGVFRKIIQ